MKITGTFLDEISHDIPSNNWGTEEWAKDFDAMAAIGIDTVVIIRAGYRDHCTFASESLSKHRSMRPAYSDLVDTFLTQAERCTMRLFFGLYDSGEYWLSGRHQEEVEINLRFTEEVADKYASRKAFAGWYMSHEIHSFDENMMNLFEQLCSHVRSLKDVPILMSPYVGGSKLCESPTTPAEHEKQWDWILSRLQGSVDILAFQDGQVEFSELPAYMEINTRLARKNNIIPWSNVESFERGMPLDFLPIAWRNLLDKMEVATEGDVEKLITFEFSHFMSPNSMYPSAHQLYRRYREWLEERP